MDSIRHYPLRLVAEPERVVIRPFHIASEPRDLNPQQLNRTTRIVEAVMAMSEDACADVLTSINADFGARHWQTREIYLERYQRIATDLDLRNHLSDVRRQVIGAHFCHEYSYAAAAIMNPSIVPHVDQSGLPQGAQRFLLSLRTVGEGHISSITFREGIIDAQGELSLWPQPPFSMAMVSDPVEPQQESVVAHLPASAPISGAVVFPFTQAQRNGLEDLRLLQFEDDSRSIYYGTYTAYSGSSIRSELLETQDFRTISLTPMRGDASKGKGMALFPKRIDGGYAVIGRQDNESLFFMQSDDLYSWNGGQRMLGPKFTWEVVQMGNCGAPIELDEGWLLLTHGVGAMRKYAIGAALLDKKNPCKVLARSTTPLLSPSANSREGYVPNVVYTCGGLKHGDNLLLPYGVADSSVAFALFPLRDLLKSLS